MTMTKRLDINRFFLPSAEITPDRAMLFAGRKAILNDSLKALDRVGSSVAIFGERGVGKSSLARVLMGLLRKQISAKTVGLPAKTTIPLAACVWQNWDAGMDAVPDLLIEILNPDKEDDHSLAKQYPDVAIEYAEQYREIREKLSKAEDAGSAASVRTQRKQAYRLFRTVESTIGNRYASDPARSRLILFLDEVERVGITGKTEGLGTFIKDSSFSFVIVGIGSTFSEILQDHKSADRKFYDSQFQIETLKKPEVRELFAKASAEAAEQQAYLDFSDEFCDRVYEDFGGYPHLIQQFGYEVADLNRDALEAGERVVVDGREYERSLRNREQRASMVKKASDAVDEGVGSSSSRWEMLCAIARLRAQNTAAKWISVKAIRQEVSHQALYKFDAALKRLVNRRVLFTKGDQQSVQIASPDILIEINRRIRIGWRPKEPPRATANSPE
jgi:energy-coupling factor transporter ATP-binding protein EcfA2